MTSSTNLVHWKKSSLLGLTLSCYALMGGTALTTTAFANEPTSLLNPKIEENQNAKTTPITIQNPLEKSTDGSGVDKTENTDAPTSDTSENPEGKNIEGKNTPTDSDTTGENTKQKELNDLLDELSQNPSYSEKTQPATTPKAGLIQTETLQTISEDSFGLIEPNQDNINLWDNTRYSHLVGLVNKTTLSITSPTLYKSTMDTVLLGAKSPKLESPHKQGDYLLARVALLSRSGHIKTAKQLLFESPIGTEPEHYGVLLNLALLGHDIPSICLLSKQLSETENLPKSVDPLLIKQMTILCKGISDNPATAYLAASALQETSDTVSYLFVDTLDFLNGGPAPDEQSLTELTPFTLLLARVTGMPINKDLLTKASPDILHSVSAHTNTTDDARIYALEQLAHTGAISAEDLSAGYGRIPFSEAKLQDPLLSLYDLSPPLQRALMVQASKGENGWKHAITLLNRLKTSEDYMMISNVLAPDFAKLVPSPEFEYAGAIIARSLLSSGYADKAQLWYDARNQFDTVTSNAIATLYPALVLAGQTTNSMTLDDSETKAWAEQMSKDTKGGLKAFTRGLSVLQALGFTIDERLWDYLEDYLDTPVMGSNDTFLAVPNSGVALLEKFARSGIFAPKTSVPLQGDNRVSTNTASSDTTSETQQATLPLDSKLSQMQRGQMQRGMTALYAMNLVGKETAATLSDGQVIQIIKSLRNALGDDRARAYGLESLVRPYTPSR